MSGVGLLYVQVCRFIGRHEQGLRYLAIALQQPYLPRVRRGVLYISYQRFSVKGLRFRACIQRVVDNSFF